MPSPFHRLAASWRRRTSGAFTFTTIFVSKSRPAFISRNVCVGRAKQYTQEWVHPRYGLIVQLNGRKFPGTLLMIDFASDSMNVMPRNSGVSNCRRAISKSCSIRLRIEHMFDSRKARLVGRVDPVRELRQHRDGDLRLLLEQLLEVLPGDREALHHRLRLDPRVPRMVGEQRQLT